MNTLCRRPCRVHEKGRFLLKYRIYPKLRREHDTEGAIEGLRLH
jgi:hypothetical protein